MAVRLAHVDVLDKFLHEWKGWMRLHGINWLKLCTRCHAVIKERTQSSRKKVSLTTIYKKDDEKYTRWDSKFSSLHAVNN